ncbi:hypothetical protein [Methylomonas koyamae]|uniref:Uncharacterized protein n=1 Tax=Methylomonas koyamae TaxID=702114 RepID=A0A291IPZ8_9GAMM|nr:hypothetical protein [Methylomonas koyamae]ATG92237.1 hypothetical protein MKLM6_4063 [Methylomonas koyamae]OAI25020.1 hypothetical protein A1356_14705 [Methylomonas koyamae]
MEEHHRKKGRFGLYAQSLLYLAVTVWSAVGAGQSPAAGDALAYLAPAGFGLIAWYSGYAALKRYRGGAWFVAGNVLLALAVLMLSVLYEGYRTANPNTMLGAGVVAAVATLAALPLFWRGHQRHRRWWRAVHGFAEFEPAAAISPEPAAPAANAPPLLFPPHSNWRLLWLMLFSATLYAPFLMYRIASDIAVLAGSRLNPRRCAWQMLIPLYNFNVFYRVARQAGRLAQAGGMAVKLSPAALALMLVAATLVNFAIPQFLFLLSCLLASIPWLVLNAWMNRLRTAQPAQWRAPPDRYTWRQRSVFLAGAPLIVLGLLGSKTEFAYFAAPALAAQQQVAGPGADYFLTIPDSQWRVVERGTLYPDTDIELVNRTSGEWVVVRISPSQQQSLDGFVDQRQALVAANWNDYEMQETRRFADGSDNIPMSLARYSYKGPLTSRDSPLLVATVLTPERVFEVVSHAGNLANASAAQLVESFRLAAGGNES